MKRGLGDYFTEAYEASGKASEIARTLGLGAVAVVWIFKNPDGAPQLLAPTLVFALLFAALSLLADLSHYLFRYFALYRFAKAKEEEFDRGALTPEQVADLYAPSYIEWWSTAFFLFKVISMAAAYVFIVLFLLNKAKLFSLIQ